MYIMLNVVQLQEGLKANGGSNGVVDDILKQNIKVE